jgi:Domain of unknown function (DUF4349)
MPVPIRRPAAALTLAAALALAACSSSGGSYGSGGSGGSSSAGRAPAQRTGSGGATGKNGTASTTLDPAAAQARVVRTAQVVVEVNGSLATAAQRVRNIAQSVGGTVANEATSYADTDATTTTPQPASTSDENLDPTPVPTARPGESVLVLRVPTDTLDRVLTQITGNGGVGKEVTRSATSQDVTADLADLQSRVTTQRASVARVRTLLAHAASLQEIVSIESEVTKRESDLEAAEARQTALAGRADFATLTVDLRLPAAVPPPAPAQPNAFVKGLNNGWEAVTASTAVVLTVLGALLPFAVVVAVLGAPVLWWLRRRRRDLPPRVAPPAAPDAGV